jgi:uncharacterized protein YkwD
MRTSPRRLTLCVVAVIALATLGTSCTRNGAAFESFQRVNAEREARGLRILRLDQALTNKAQDWADHMAATGRVSHSVLTAGVETDWRVLGENVGAAGSVGDVHALFMNSAPHRRSILDGRFDRVGTGVTEAQGRYYVVQVFAG